ncbi:MAG: outer membrane protein OmpA-like peptidoglycan-associated protein [Myxococcota bacterium]
MPPPPTANPALPLTVLSPTGQRAGEWSAGGLLELVDAPVLFYTLDAAGEPEESRALAGAFAVNLHGRWAVRDRVHLGVTAPVFLGASGDAGAGGLALGDAHLWVPISLVVPDTDARGFGLDLVPWLDLPTGASQRLLGDRGFRGGLAPALGIGVGPMHFATHVGLVAGGTETVGLQQVGGAALVAGGAVTARLGQLGIGLEARSSASLSAAARPDLDASVDADTGGVAVPTEVMLTLGAALPGRAFARGGVGRGVTSGLGAANFRAFIGAGAGGGPSEEAATVVAADLVVFVVTDVAGAPVEGATVYEAGAKLGTTDAAGRVEIPTPRWRRGVLVAAPGRRPVEVAEPEGALPPIVLPASPVPPALSVVTQAGGEVVARLTALPVDVPGVTEPVQGMLGDVRLAPGLWDLTVTASGYGEQVRRVFVPVGGGAGATEMVLLEPGGEAIMSPTITGPDGAPLPGARVLLDGLPVGTSGFDGRLAVAGLASGAHRLEVQATGFTPMVRDGLPVVGEVTFRVALSRLPGSVQVSVRDVRGAPVEDAVLRFLGPSRLAPMPLGATGERVQVLGAGRWVLVVSSPSSGIQEREVVVPVGSDDLIRVNVVLRPEEPGDAELRVIVVDPEGTPVDGAEVTLDGAPVGATSTGGRVTLPGLSPGLRDLGVSAPWFDGWPAEQVLVVDGPNEVVVPLTWVAGATAVTVTGPEGPVVDATVRASGPAVLPPVDVGLMGSAFFQLPEGEWSLTVASPGTGLAVSRLAIDPLDRRLHRVNVRLGDVDGGLAELALAVSDPDGRPVDGAEVSVDDVVVGTTTNVGVIEVRGLTVGDRRLGVWAPLLLPLERNVALLEDREEVDLALDWAPGAVRFRVDGPAGPVRDALLRIHGPGRVPPARVDRYGERTLVLGAGRWQVLAASPTTGLAQRTFDVIPEAGALQEVAIPLAPVAAGMSSLWLRVESDWGAPVVGARVTLGGDPVGTTGEGGSVLLDSLPPGPATLTVAAEGFRAAEPVTVELGQGPHERLLRLEAIAGSVGVSVVAPDGTPAEAELVLAGPADHPGTGVSPGEAAVLELPPGEWSIVAVSTAFGPGRQSVVVEPGQASEVQIQLTRRVAVMGADAVVLDAPIRFEFDRADLNPDAAPVLDAVAALLLTRSGLIGLEVAGHTDNVGDLAYNRDLSQRRAEAVLEALVARGVPRELLSSVGYGAQKPVNTSDDDVGHAANRRVEFRVVEEMQ